MPKHISFGNRSLNGFHEIELNRLHHATNGFPYRQKFKFQATTIKKKKIQPKPVTTQTYNRHTATNQ